MIKCGACGAENPATEAYCEDCGAGLGGAATPPAGETHPSTPVQPQGDFGKLVLVAGNKDYPCNKDVMTIGRRSPADGVYPDVDLTDYDTDSYVSRRHAQVIHQGGQYIFEDVGSANGSFVNNVRAVKGNQSILKDNDQVRLGKTEMIFRAPGA
jgi:pSer/pThr/pTyr-binding forkhead associated (FHA) protein